MTTPFHQALSLAKRSAVHLEMRDTYRVADEAGDFARWKAGGGRDMDPHGDYWQPWLDLVSDTMARGVVMRRARIVSEPVSDYIWFEYEGTAINVASGEQVRWLPRRQAVDLALPGADFWCFDDEVVVFNLFTGDGGWAEPDMELRIEPTVARLCTSAFEAVWTRAIPHEDYRPV